MKQKHKINGEVRFDKVRLVGDNVEGGIMSSYEASKLSDDMELDLVCINDKSDIPVCKIMNYEKFIYKQKRENKQQKSLPLKEIKFGPNISEHDIDTKVRHIIKFLDKGHKVKTYVQFRGREMAHQDLGMKVLMIVATKVQDYGVPEAIPNKVVGRRLIMQLKPKQR